MGEMDGDNQKVFASGITINSSILHNNLYDIIQRDVIQPIAVKKEVQDECKFDPNCNKYYVPKKKSKLKVLTVRDVRNLYEMDIFESLPRELEKQQKLLLRKIRDGYSKDESTKNTALNLLKSNKPLSRASWQMLMNINPEGHSHCSQYFLWNGKCIQINGSKGGKSKFICNYDIKRDQESLRRTSATKRKLQTRKRSLLRESLNIRFKPGPLRKKKDLDYSYQKYNVGETKLVNLPKIGLQVQPSYGTALEPTITTFLQNMLEKDGTISEKWAEFAGSVLGKVTNDGAKIETDNSVTFNLNYKYDQKLILMRNDLDKALNAYSDAICKDTDILCTMYNDDLLIYEVRDIVNRMLDSVEIHLKQDSMYSGEDEPREISIINNGNCKISSSHFKEKEKKRKYGELDRLDVTIIRISENRKINNVETCSELFCSLGCICDSLECEYKIKEHCGRIDCMFSCNCDFSKFKITDSLESDCSEFIPGLFNLDKKINNKLSKEEQKFHQTVIVTEDKSILLKSRRRNWKTSKKYADFYSSLPLRTEIKNQKFPVIIITKLKCENIEPWCMIHNLYKCFCKGKFTQSFIYGLENAQTAQNNTIRDKVLQVVVEKPINAENNESTKCDIKTIIIDSEVESLCARVLPYKGRKYSNRYYRRMNEKFFEMEKNDTKLHSKMMALVSGSQENKQRNEEKIENNIIDVANAPFRLDGLLNNILDDQNRLMDNIISENENVTSKQINKTEKTKPPFNVTKLVEWLETSYKKYKELIDAGDWKTSLSPPRYGKIALYPWNFILSRYQERKNLFLISIQKPFRIFMAVDARHPFFDRCINMAHIPESSLSDYPVMVRNLIQNAKDLKDNFCILCGLSHCWELIGSVTKVNENKLTPSNSKTIHESTLHKDVSSNNLKCYEQTCDNSFEDITSIDLKDDSKPELSKWFVMTVENDFNEIQFYKRGFFVKYDSIIKSIGVARTVGKTVRLSSQRCIDISNGPQFGIYATPDTNENSVFIGPYEKEEPLGIETVRNSLEVLEKKTRGLWITINKIDNPKLIDNPLSFMPLIKKDRVSAITIDVDTKDRESAVTLDGDTDSDLNKYIDLSSSLEITDLSDESRSPVKHSDNVDKKIKTIKPIKIRKANGFYHLVPQSLLKQLSFRNCLQQTNKMSDRGNSAPLGSGSLNNFPIKTIETTQLRNCKINNKTLFNKPVAEIAPQIKFPNIASLCSNNSETMSNKRKSVSGMFVLKPEEINKRLAKSFFHIMQPIDNENTIETSSVKSLDEDTRLDVEKFIDSSLICNAPDSDVYVISDDEDDYLSDKSSSSVLKNVWIICVNIKSIGWISGRRNNENKLSFEFPGFAFSDYYEEEEAFNKINQVFSRKVYVPKNITMKWRVIEKEEELGTKCQLRIEDLKGDFVLSSGGLKHKNNVVITDKKPKNNDSCVKPETSEFASEVCMEDEEVTGVSKIINDENIMDNHSEEEFTTVTTSMSLDVTLNVKNKKIGRNKRKKAKKKETFAVTKTSMKNVDLFKTENKMVLNDGKVCDGLGSEQGTLDITATEVEEILEAQCKMFASNKTKSDDVENEPAMEIITGMKTERLTTEDQIIIELD